MLSISSAEQSAEPTIHMRDSIIFGSGQRVRFVEVSVPEHDPARLWERKFSRGELGFNRIISVRPQALGEAFGLAWDGDVQHPGIMADVLDSRPFRFILEVWGL